MYTRKGGDLQNHWQVSGWTYLKILFETRSRRFTNLPSDNELVVAVALLILLLDAADTTQSLLFILSSTKKKAQW